MVQYNKKNNYISSKYQNLANELSWDKFAFSCSPAFRDMAVTEMDADLSPTNESQVPISSYVDLKVQSSPVEN